MCVGSPTAGAWSSFQRRPDDEFETDSRDDASNVASTASSSVLRYHETMVRDVARPPSSASNRSEPRSLLASETRPPVSPDSSSSSGSNWKSAFLRLVRPKRESRGIGLHLNQAAKLSNYV